MRRNPVQPGNLVHLELPGLQKLRFLRRNPDLLVLHALFQNGNLPRILRAPVDSVPALPHLRRVLQHPRMLQNAARRGPVLKEPRPVFLTGQRHPHRILRHGNGRIPHQPVKPKPGDMQHILPRKIHPAVLPKVRVLVTVPVIDIIKLPLTVPVNLHLVRQQRVQPQHPAPAVPYDLRIGIPPDQKMAHKRLPEHKRSHLRVRLVMQEIIQRMVIHPLLPPPRIPVQMHRQGSNRLRQNPHTGIDRRGLHGRPLIHDLPAAAPPKQKGISRTPVTVPRLIPRPPDTQNRCQLHKHLLKISKKEAPPKRRPLYVQINTLLFLFYRKTDFRDQFLRVRCVTGAYMVDTE